MATTTIRLTPAELQAQAAEMNALKQEYVELLLKVSENLKDINGNWSVTLAQNFSGKISSTQKASFKLTEFLNVGETVAIQCAKSMESVDAALAKRMQSEDITSETSGSAAEVEKPKKMDVNKYCDRATDAEYARLCKLLYDALKEEDPKEAFAELVKKDKYLPENDPIKNISADQIGLVESFTGFSALTIAKGDTVLVIFCGTNGDVGDYVSDALLTISQTSPQAVEANGMVEALSHMYSNIVVTGHSLGGYLATSATLHNKNVSQCVAFDPPGRYDVGFQSLLNGRQTAKITTYEADGSIISSVGVGVGDVNDLEVKENGSGLARNHGIKQICDALGGKKKIKNSWN